VGKLPEASFHTTLETQLVCPKCDATYNLVVDYEASINRFFEDEARPLIQKLRKAIFLGHADGHCVEHFETAGVIVISHMRPEPPALSKSIH
jgi:hypothetical protein